jgi:hypothetical protein
MSLLLLFLGIFAIFGFLVFLSRCQYENYVNNVYDAAKAFNLEVYTLSENEYNNMLPFSRKMLSDATIFLMKGTLSGRDAGIIAVWNDPGGGEYSNVDRHFVFTLKIPRCRIVGYIGKPDYYCPSATRVKFPDTLPLTKKYVVKADDHRAMISIVNGGFLALLRKYRAYNFFVSFNGDKGVSFRTDRKVLRNFGLFINATDELIRCIEEHSSSGEESSPYI